MPTHIITNTYYHVIKLTCVPTDACTHKHTHARCIVIVPCMHMYVANNHHKIILYSYVARKYINSV